MKTKRALPDPHDEPALDDDALDAAVAAGDPVGQGPLYMTLVDHSTSLEIQEVGGSGGFSNANQMQNQVDAFASRFSSLLSAWRTGL